MSTKATTAMASVVALLLLVGGGCSSDTSATGSGGARRSAQATPGQATPGVTEAAYVESLPFTLVETVTDVDPGHEFTFALGYDPTALPGSSPLDLTAAVEVFSDVALTTPAAHFAFFSGGTLKVEPPSSTDTAVGFRKLPELVLSAEKEWGLDEDYYIVQKLDPDTGDVLEKPLVTHFTVASPLPAPDAVVESVDESGVAHLTWDAVEGASSYYVVKFVHTVDADGVFRSARPSAQVVGMTDGTQWTTLQDDERLVEEIDLGRVTEQNLAMATTVIDDDRFSDSIGSHETGAQHSERIHFGVVAQGDAGLSSYRPIDGTGLTARLPLMVASNAASEIGLTTGRSAETFDGLPTAIPVSMADGRTVQLPVVFEPAGAGRGTTFVAVEHDDGTVTDGQEIPVVTVPFSVSGSMISGTYSVKQFDEATVDSELARIVERNKLARAKTGASTDYEYTMQPKDISELTPVSTTPDVPYRINATSPAGAYLAAHLIAGTECIDMSAYFGEGQDGPPLFFEDLMEEVQHQNTYVMYVGDYYYYADAKILEVSYLAPIEQLQAEQAAIAAEVTRVADEIVTDGAGDRETALAINDYLAETAEYDHVALDMKSSFGMQKVPHAWTAYGILLDKTGVCASYAYAFKALADEAGLETVVVTGMVGPDGHAWNKAKIDGAWTNIDVTWNDGTPPGHDYFGLTDEQISQTRVIDNTWMNDALIAGYATP